MTQARPDPFLATAAEPADAAPRLRRLRGPLILGGAVAFSVLMLRLRDPHTAGAWGFCPFKLGTGLDCPGCGGLRAVNDLTHLDVASAFSSNAWLMIAGPLIVVLWLWWLVRAFVGSRRLTEKMRVRLGFLLCGSLVVFGVLRNLPGFEYLRS